MKMEQIINKVYEKYDGIRVVGLKLHIWNI